MALSEEEKRELLSFNTGEPIVVTPCDSSDDCDKYNIVIFVRTIADPTPQYIESVQLTILYSASYPNESPSVRLCKTQLFHPNFTGNGMWISNAIQDGETISKYLMRLIRTLQFKEIDIKNIADRNAMAWYNKHRNGGIFPTDQINYNAKPRISIIRVNEASTL